MLMLLGFTGGRDDPRLLKTRCPTCGARGNFRKHGSYERWSATASKKGRKPDKRLRVERVLCRNCRRTHSLIPAHLIPRSLYPEPFRRLVFEAGRPPRALSVNRVCAMFEIDVRTFYRIRSARDGPDGEKAASTCAHS